MNRIEVIFDEPVCRRDARASLPSSITVKCASVARIMSGSTPSAAAGLIIIFT